MGREPGVSPVDVLRKGGRESLLGDPVLDVAATPDRYYDGLLDGVHGDKGREAGDRSTS